MDIKTMALPLEGLRVLEFTHAVMGPCCGLLLADDGRWLVVDTAVLAETPTVLSCPWA